MPVAPWLIHAWIDTGAPLSPVPLEIFGITLGEAHPHFEWWRLRPDVGQAASWDGERRMLAKLFSPPGSRYVTLGLGCLPPLALLPLGWIACLRRSRWTGCLIVAVTIATLAVLYLPGAAVWRYSNSAPRYVLGLVLIAYPVSMIACSRRPLLSRVYFGIVFATAAFHALYWSRFGWAPHEAAQIAGGLAALVGFAVLLAFAARRRSALALALCVVLLLPATWLLRRSSLAHRYDAAQRSLQLHEMPRYWVPGAELLDTPGEPRVLAVTAGPSQRSAYWFAYFYLGSQLQNELHYVPITADGTIAHFGPMQGRSRQSDVDAWLRRIDDRGISHVVSFAPRSLEHEWMESRPDRFERIVGDAAWGVFRVR